MSFPDLGQIFKMIPNVMKMALGLIKTIPQMLKALPLLIKLLIFIVTELPIFWIKYYMKVFTFYTNAAKYPFAVIVSFFIIFLLLQTLISQLTGIPGLIPHLPLACFALFIIVDLVLHRAHFLAKFQTSLIKGFLFIFDNPISRPLLGYNVKGNNFIDIIKWCATNSVTIIMTLFAVAFFAKYSFAYMQTMIAAGLDGLGIGGIIPEAPLTVITFAILYDLLVNNPYILGIIQRVFVGFTSAAFNNQLAKYLINYDIDLNSKENPGTKLKKILEWLVKNMTRVFLYCVSLVLLVKYIFEYSQTMVGGVLELFGIGGLIPEGPLTLISIFLLYDLFANNTFIVDKLKGFINRTIFGLFTNPLVRMLLNFHIDVNPSNVSDSMTEIFKWGTNNFLRVFGFGICMAIIIKYVFDYSLTITSSFTDFLGIGGIIPEGPLTIVSLFIVYDLFVNNTYIVNTVGGIVGRIILGLLNYPLVRMLLNFNIDLDPNNLTQSSIPLFEWASNNFLRLFGFIIFMILIVKYLFEYSQGLISGGLDAIGIGGIIPEGPLTIISLFVIFDLLTNNIYIVNKINNFMGKIILGLLDNPLVRMLLNFNIDLNENNITENSIPLFKCAS